jgi:hypothetical protein
MATAAEVAAMDTALTARSVTAAAFRALPRTSTTYANVLSSYKTALGADHYRETISRRRLRAAALQAVREGAVAA